MIRDAEPGPDRLDILYVEDDPGHARLAMMCFEQLPEVTSVRHVPDGETALDYLFRRGPFADPARSPRPELVLVDLRLPRIDGLEVLRQIRSHPELRRLPVVVLSTSDSAGDIQAAYDLSANSYLVKPFGLEAFNDTLRRVGSYWLGVNRSPHS